MKDENANHIEVDVDTLEDRLVNMFDELALPYNKGVVAKLADVILEMIESGDLSQSDPEFAENYVISVKGSD